MCVHAAGNFLYILLEDSTAQIIFYTETVGDLVIPAELDGHVVSSIGKGIFRKLCKSNITIPDSVTCIGENAFSNCPFLSSITIPDSVSLIGAGAFSECPSLTSITIPDSVSHIGEGAFTACSNLAAINVSSNHPTLAVIDGILLDKAEKRLICCSTAFTASSYEIPQGIRIIGESAFSFCKSLTNVTISDRVTAIGGAAFCCCDSLTSITIPDSVTTIGDSAFVGCAALKRITIPERVTRIEHAVFACCSSLTSITLPNGLTCIEKEAFHGCESLANITIPDSVTSIGANAFPRSITLTVSRNSYAAQYCEEKGYNYISPDPNDRLPH